jgi:hypothetical protein
MRTWNTPVAHDGMAVVVTSIALPGSVFRPRPSSFIRVRIGCMHEEFRRRVLNSEALVVFADKVKTCRLNWFGLAWGCQEKGRRIRSKNGSKVASAAPGVELLGLTARRNAPATTE